MCKVFNVVYFVGSVLGKMLIYNLISYNIVCNTNTTTNANEIKALTRVESGNINIQ